MTHLEANLSLLCNRLDLRTDRVDRIFSIKCVLLYVSDMSEMGLSSISAHRLSTTAVCHCIASGKVLLHHTEPTAQPRFSHGMATAEPFASVLPAAAFRQVAGPRPAQFRCLYHPDAPPLIFSAISTAQQSVCRGKHLQECIRSHEHAFRPLSDPRCQRYHCRDWRACLSVHHHS